MSRLVAAAFVTLALATTALTACAADAGRTGYSSVSRANQEKYGP